MTSASREIEFKFGVAGKKSFSQLVKYLDLPSSVLTEGIMQNNHFFDSKAQCLHKNHFVIRLREERNKNILTIKGERQSQNSGSGVLTNRVEEEVVIPRETAVQLLRGSIAPLQAISSHFESKSARLLQMIEAACKVEELVYIGEFSNVRIHLPPVTLDVGNSTEKVEFELDSSTFPDGSTDYEFEIEITEHIDAAAIETALVQLFQQAGIKWHVAPSKAERFFASLAND